MLLSMIRLTLCLVWLLWAVQIYAHANSPCSQGALKNLVSALKNNAKAHTFCESFPADGRCFVPVLGRRCRKWTINNHKGKRCFDNHYTAAVCHSHHNQIFELNYQGNMSDYFDQSDFDVAHDCIVGGTADDFGNDFTDDGANLSSAQHNHISDNHIQAGRGSF
ncbi:unnamed protein product [Zymoseptoria tritici ST99CH_3D1]|nr:unnamed protein product [Zymoseptoria tritici ST99CH_3D1]